MTEINERTKLPLKLVASLILSVSSLTIGGAVWVTTFYNNQIAQGHQLEKLALKEETHDSALGEIKTDLAEIKTDLQYIKKAIDKKRNGF